MDSKDNELLGRLFGLCESIADHLRYDQENDRNEFRFLGLAGNFPWIYAEFHSIKSSLQELKYIDNTLQGFCLSNPTRFSYEMLWVGNKHITVKLIHKTAT